MLVWTHRSLKYTVVYGGLSAITVLVKINTEMEPRFYIDNQIDCHSLVGLRLTKQVENLVLNSLNLLYDEN